MEVVLIFVKNYFVLMLIFYLLSYLTPKETYQKYFHFFVSVLVITVLAQPLLVYVGGMKKEEARQQLHEIVEQMESIEYQEKGENIFEQYLGKVDQKEEYIGFRCTDYAWGDGNDRCDADGGKTKPERNTDAGTKGAAAADGRFL